MSTNMEALLERLPDYLGGHIFLSMTALAVGLGISIPLGIMATRKPKLAEYLLGAAGIVQTIPTLALLALAVFILGTIGTFPAFIALTLYSILPILASTITGIRGIDPTLVEAARALGMNEWQLLRRVQLPLAAPVILSGVRTATVLVVGTATLALPVGGLSLGNYIFAGLSMSNPMWTVFGCIFTALLAIYMDQLVHLLEAALARREKRLAWIAAAGFAIALVFGLYKPIERRIMDWRAPRVTVASGPFTEQFILSEAMSKLLRDNGQRVDQRQAMSETIQFMALKSDKPVVCVNYLGNIWVTLMDEDKTAPPEVMLAGVRTYMAQFGIEVHPVGFKNNYVFAVAKNNAKTNGVLAISDLSKPERQGKLRVAGDEQFFNRPEWRWVQEEYKTRFARIREMDPSLIVDALKNREVDVICAYSTDARLNNFRLLDDDRHMLPEYDAVLLLSRSAANNDAIKSALLPMAGKIGQEPMTNANASVDLPENGKEPHTPREAADQLLKKALPRVGG